MGFWRILKILREPGDHEEVLRTPKDPQGPSCVLMDYEGFGWILGVLKDCEDNSVGVPVDSG